MIIDKNYKGIIDCGGYYKYDGDITTDDRVIITISIVVTGCLKVGGSLEVGKWLKVGEWLKVGGWLEVGKIISILGEKTKKKLPETLF